MTPLEFTARINDEMFNDQDNWVRAIEFPSISNNHKTI